MLEAEEKLADARADRDRDAAQNARDLADAQKDLTRALQDQASAENQASSEAKKYQEALDNLSDSARVFVETFVGMQPKFEAFRKSLQEAFFSELNVPFFDMLNTVLPAIQPVMTETARIMGVLGAQFSTALTDNIDLFVNALEGGNRILTIFTVEGENGYSMMEGLVVIFGNLWKAIEPVTTRFSEWLAMLVDSGAATLETEEGLGRLTEFFDRAGDRMAQVRGDFRRNISTFRYAGRSRRPSN